MHSHEFVGFMSGAAGSSRSEATRYENVNSQNSALFFLTAEVLTGALSAALPAEDAVKLATCCHSTREELLHSTGAQAAWAKRISSDFGPGARAVVTHTGNAVVDGFRLYCQCARFLQSCSSCLEAVNASVADASEGFDCVACPVLTSLVNAGIGAQGAIRHRAGDELEEFIDEYLDENGDLDPLQVVLAPGGQLAPAIALIVTEPPEWAFIFNVSNFLLQMHRNLIATVRAGGHRSLSMPTLGTNGMGFPAPKVCKAAVQAAVEDFREHPLDPLRVRVCCFENFHYTSMNGVLSQTRKLIFEEEP